MSSGSKIGFLLALAILGSIGAYFAFGPGATGGPPLQMTDASEGAATPPTPDSVELSTPGESPSDRVPPGDTTEGRFARFEERDPIIVIDDFEALADRERTSHGTLTDPDLIPVPAEPLQGPISDGGKDDVFVPVLVAGAEGVPTDEDPANVPPVAPPEQTSVDEIEADFTDYVVKEGDNFWSIATMWFGDGTKHDLIRAANPTADPSRLQIGQRLRLPPKSATASGAAEPTPTPPAPRVDYTIMPGDTLMSIARARFNDETRWRAIYDLNRNAIGQDPNDLKAGTVLILPE